MRWKESKPVRGDLRNQRRFLLLPLKINGETRWLEWADWVEVFGYSDDVEEILHPREKTLCPPRPEPIRFCLADWHPVKFVS